MLRVDARLAEAHRGNGFGGAITARLLGLAHHEGAGYAWLNVLADDEAGLRTYAKLGFETLYEYWYRTREA